MTAVLDPVRQLDALLSSLAAEDVHAQPDEALLAEIQALQAAADLVQAEMLRRLAVADARGATTTQYGIGTRAWLRASTRMSVASPAIIVVRVSFTNVL